MRKISIALLSMALFSMQAAFADDYMNGDESDKSCVTVVKACKDAGYTRNDNSDKQFWKDCMKPLLMGQSVKNVTLEGDVAKTCRQTKIEKMKKEIEEFQKVN